MGCNTLKFCWLLVASLTAVISDAAGLQPPVQIPVLSRLIVPEARLPIRLKKVAVNAEVLGSISHTRIEMVFFNPNDRVLEGELQFPLLDGQTVTGFALDINGELRAAVPVEKVKGQQVFEDVSRARIDPALLEKTQGNNYKLRVYPLPSHGSRRVVLNIDEVLSSGRYAYLSYRLPLQFAAKVEQLDIAVHNPTSPARYSAMAVSAQMGAERLKVAYEFEKAAKSGSRVALSRKDYQSKEVLSIDFPALADTGMVTETRDNQTYFYSELKLPPSKAVKRESPKHIGIVWDASGSGMARDHDKEFALLDAYFKALKNVRVALILARDRAETLDEFTIVDGDWSSLRKTLQNVAYDGASSVSALSPPPATQLNLLFSDGLTNYGDGEFSAGAAPLFTVYASSSSDLPRLVSWADRSGGSLLNVSIQTAENAVRELTRQSPRLIALSGLGVKELVSAPAYAASGRLMIAGILTAPDASIELDWDVGQGQRHRQTIAVKNATVSSMAANRWASLKLAQLEFDDVLNRAAIARLGKQFSLVSRETSLIVLDRVEDYVRYEIVPPESLRAEYEFLFRQKELKISEQRSAHLDEIAQKFSQKMDWWEKTFPKDDKPAPVKLGEIVVSGAMPRNAVMAMAPMAVASMPPDRMMSAPMPLAKSTVNPSVPAELSIQLKKWQPESPYATRLRAAAPEQMYAIYLDERPAYANSTAFFLDAADIFIERGQVDLGLRILSNLAEMNLENRQILRILAYRLLQAKQTQDALPVLRQVLALSPNEPQSWRDLGLAYAEAGQFQLAVDNLWEVVAHPWHDRFPDIELIALAELNAIIARAPKALNIDTSRMDGRLLRNLPLDVRAVLSWDADNTDIDLWVTDPNDEKVYYANRLGYQGGSMSRDFTGGYGPEEFSLRDAKPGKYKVQAQFYGNRQQVVSGATTLMLRLSTGFGTAAQQDQNTMLRLTGQGALVDVGTFEVQKH